MDGITEYRNFLLFGKYMNKNQHEQNFLCILCVYLNLSKIYIKNKVNRILDILLLIIKFYFIGLE